MAARSTMPCIPWAPSTTNWVTRSVPTSCCATCSDDSQHLGSESGGYLSALDELIEAPRHVFLYHAAHEQSYPSYQRNILFAAGRNAHGRHPDSVRAPDRLPVALSLL